MTRTEFQYGGWWKRKIALTIDTIIMLFLAVMIGVAIPDNYFALNLIYQITAAAFFTWFIASKFQASPGLMAMKLKVGDLDGNRLSLMQSFVRYLVLYIPVWPFVVVTGLPGFMDVFRPFETVDPNDMDAMTALVQTPEVMGAIGLVSITTFIMFFVGLIWVLPIVFTSEKTGIHDMICKTRVFKTNISDKE